MTTISGTGPTPKTSCVHDSTRGDGTLDCNCLRCGADGYWHNGHRHDRDHPSGKVLVTLGCPDAPGVTLMTCQTCGAAEPAWWVCHRQDCCSFVDLKPEPWVRLADTTSADQKEKENA